MGLGWKGGWRVRGWMETEMKMYVEWDGGEERELALR